MTITKRTVAPGLDPVSFSDNSFEREMPGRARHDIRFQNIIELRNDFRL